MSIVTREHKVYKANLSSTTRVDSGYVSEALTADKQLTFAAEKFQEVTAADAGNNIILPEADSGKVSVGWKVRVKVGDSSAESVTVQTYDAATPVDLRAVLPGKTYEFVLVDVGTAAGSWRVYSVLGPDELEAERYVDTFNATTDWTLNGDSYEHTVTGATHGISGNNPAPHTWAGASAPFERVQVGESFNASGDYTISVSATPDNRFAGRTIIM